MQFNKHMNDKLLLGAPTIDRQHQQLIDSLEKIRSAIGSTDPEEVLSAELSSLGVKICQHFATEEGLMGTLGLPAPILRSHQKAHELMLEEFTQIHLNAMYGVKAVLPDVIAMVSSWVNLHLLESDLALKPYIERATRPQPT
jgi:hemerythrin